MEQPCYKCGQVLEEGRPFCPHCGAPQIRVLVAEPAAGALGEAAAGVALPSSLPATETVPVLAVSGTWSQGLKPCALAATVGILLMCLRLHPLMAMFSAGFLAVVFYRQSRSSVAITPTTGGKLGALSGFFGFALMALLVAFSVMVPEIRTKLHDAIIESHKELIESAQQYAAAHPDTQVQATLDQMKTPEGLVMTLIVSGLLFLILSVVLGALGGVLGGGIFGRRNHS